MCATARHPAQSVYSGPCLEEVFKSTPAAQSAAQWLDLYNRTATMVPEGYLPGETLSLIATREGIPPLFIEITSGPLSPYRTIVTLLAHAHGNESQQDFVVIGYRTIENRWVTTVEPVAAASPLLEHFAPTN